MVLVPAVPQQKEEAAVLAAAELKEERVEEQLAQGRVEVEVEVAVADESLLMWTTKQSSCFLS